MTALIGGEVQLVLSGIGTMLPQVRAGKLKALAVSGAERSPLAPEIPTIAESGVPGYAATTWYAVLGPAGLPAPVLERLNAELRRVLGDADTRAQLRTQGIEAAASSPQELASFVQAEVAKWEKVVRATGVRID